MVTTQKTMTLSGLVGRSQRGVSHGNQGTYMSWLVRIERETEKAVLVRDIGTGFGPATGKTVWLPKSVIRASGELSAFGVTKVREAGFRADDAHGDIF